MVDIHSMRSWQLMAVLVMCTAVIGFASAVSITESPDQVNNGEMITINIQDLPNSSVFTLLIEATFLVTPGQKFSFETTDFYMPITLNNGKISASTQNTRETSLLVQKGEKTVGMKKNVNQEGIFSVSEEIAIPSGKFEYIRLQGTTAPESDRIIAGIQLTGNKVGPASSKLSFVIKGIENGVMYLTVLVNGSTALSKKVTIGSGLPEGSGSSTSAGETMFYSVDRNVVLKAMGTDHAGLVSIISPPVPSDWIKIGEAYLIISPTVTFPSSATISFSVPPTDGADYAYFIARYEDTAWTMVPTMASVNTISGRIDSPGMFALMAFKQESTISPTSSAQSIKKTAAAQFVPRVASIARVDTAVSTSTRAPLDVMVVIGAFTMGIVLVSRMRR